MRGTFCRHIIEHGFQRFIPAYAGNIYDLFLGSCLQTVHPRVCGEHAYVFEFCATDAGSSPRMRGTFLTEGVYPAFSRFIPAYAGNINLVLACLVTPAVHPRVCGEHIELTYEPAQGDGSSPRMRGTSRMPFKISGLKRFIPAYAGNITQATRYSCQGAVHPRVCGEHSEQVFLNDLEFGSSPRMRGTYLISFRSDTVIRFIPAYAGNMAGMGNNVIKLSVHPRVCGEH